MDKVGKLSCWGADQFIKRASESSRIWKPQSHPDIYEHVPSNSKITGSADDYQVKKSGPVSILGHTRQFPNKLLHQDEDENVPVNLQI